MNPSPHPSLKYLSGAPGRKPLSAYHDSHKEIKDVPAVLPEDPEAVYPLDHDLQHKHGQGAVVEDF